MWERAFFSPGRDRQVNAYALPGIACEDRPYDAFVIWMGKDSQEHSRTGLRVETQTTTQQTHDYAEILHWSLPKHVFAFRLLALWRESSTPLITFGSVPAN